MSRIGAVTDDDLTGLEFVLALSGRTSRVQSGGLHEERAADAHANWHER